MEDILYRVICLHRSWLFPFKNAASRSNLLMELVKAVASKGSQTGQSIAVRSEQKSYSYHQLISSAWRISTLLCNGGLKTVS